MQSFKVCTCVSTNRRRKLNGSGGFPLSCEEVRSDESTLPFSSMGVSSGDESNAEVGMIRPQTPDSSWCSAWHNTSESSFIFSMERAGASFLLTHGWQNKKSANEFPKDSSVERVLALAFVK